MMMKATADAVVALAVREGNASGGRVSLPVRVGGILATYTKSLK